MAQKIVSSKDSKHTPGRILTEIHPTFTDREQTILNLVADGMSNREIAEYLTLSPTTVKWYIKQIFNKLGANRRTEAVKMAAQLHLGELTASVHDTGQSLPTPLTALIGREKEVKEIVHFLNDPTIRLITILGAGGVGKTRLALDVAQRQMNVMPGQVCFVSLDSIASLSGMIQAIATGIGIQFHGSLPLGRQLLVNLRNRKLILVLDNFEQLLETTTFIREMLLAAPHLKILTTSRERLNLSIEVVYGLQGLNYSMDTGSMEESDAFQLFIRTVRYSQPAFISVGDDALYISKICQRVDGLPLAIELAARWIDVLTPKKIADEIAKDLSILQTTWQDVPERHRNVYAVFERSWRLLSEEEQAVFQKLCVFLGSFDSAAAEDVSGATWLNLSTFVDKSLLTRVGRERFKLHELVRQFIKEKLQGNRDEFSRTLHKHCQHYANRMEEWEKQVKADVSMIPVSLQGIQNEYDNILAGWHYALDSGYLSEIGKYAFVISLFFEKQGLIFEAEHSFAQALSILDSQISSPSYSDHIRLITHYGWFLLVRGQFEAALQVLQSGPKFDSELSDFYKADLGLWQLFRCIALLACGQPTASRESASLSLSTCQDSKFQFGIWMCLSLLGEINLVEGNYEEAFLCHQKALTLSEQYQDIHGTLQSSAHLGCISASLGKRDDAVSFLQQSMALMQTFLSVDALFLTILGIVGVYKVQGQTIDALKLLALLLHHPQYGSPATSATVIILLKEIQSQLSAEHFASIMNQAKQKQASTTYLDRDFTITPSLVDQLHELLDAAIQEKPF
jgi:predicted ATPase/DNA-binding CsgD family transcriptional regulator